MDDMTRLLIRHFLGSGLRKLPWLQTIEQIRAWPEKVAQETNEHIEEQARDRRDG